MPNPNSKKEPNFGWLDLVKAVYFLLEGKRKSYLTYTIILLMVLFYDLVPTLVIARIVDFFTMYTPGDSLTPFYGYVIFLSATTGIVALIRLTVKRKLSNIQSEVTYFTRIKGFEKLMDFSIKWHDAENTGNKVQRIQNGTDSLKQLQASLSNDVFVHATAIIGTLGILLFMRPLFFVYCLAYLAVFTIVQMSFYGRMVELNYAHNIATEKAGGTYYEGLGNILTIKTLGVKDDFKMNIMSGEALSRDFSIKKHGLMNNKWKSFQIINAIALGGIVFLTGQNFVIGAFSLGTIFIIYNYFQKLSGAVSRSTDVVDKLINAKVSISRMMPIFLEKSDVRQGTNGFPHDWDTLRLENATFTYPQRTSGVDSVSSADVGITGVNVTIKRNEKIGVVGKSGGGKSTFAKLLLGLHELNSGKYTIGDTDFYSIKHEEVTSNVALVLQDSEMFNLSLKENITLMREFDATLFARAIEISQLADVTEKLPQGVDTLIGEKGYRLSGGERQRIGIARAVYKDPDILVLDEATSSLDTRTESHIQRALEEKLQKKTVISIAHRISTLKNTDRVIVFDRGTIAEIGTFNELSNNPSSTFSEIQASVTGMI